MSTPKATPVSDSVLDPEGLSLGPTAKQQIKVVSLGDKCAKPIAKPRTIPLVNVVSQAKSPIRALIHGGRNHQIKSAFPISQVSVSDVPSVVANVSPSSDEIQKNDDITEVVGELINGSVSQEGPSELTSGKLKSELKIVKIVSQNDGLELG